jgi:hypothetical protein
VSHELSVEVLDADGEPVDGVEVNIHVTGILKGGDLEPDFTDATGHAEFETSADYEDSRDIYITVSGQRFGPFEIGGGAYTVTLD